MNSAEPRSPRSIFTPAQPKGSRVSSCDLVTVARPHSLSCAGSRSDVVAIAGNSDVTAVVDTQPRPHEGVDQKQFNVSTSARISERTSTRSIERHNGIAINDCASTSVPHASFRSYNQSDSQLASFSTAKHPRPDSNERPVVKRTRSSSRPNFSLDLSTLSQTIPSRIAASPPSPLFFSYTDHQRARLPQFPSISAEAVAIMNKTRDDSSSGVKTVKLVRGSIQNVESPSRPIHSASWASIERTSERSSASKSPGRQTGQQILNNVGIMELLEQDERPTFIIDIANPANFNAGGTLQLVFANASLRAHGNILDMVSGLYLEMTGFSDITHNFPEFKSWALSYVKNYEALDVALPSFIFGGFTWTGSTLRKRLRVFSGSGSGLAALTGSVSSGGGQSYTSGQTRGRSLATVTRSPLDAEVPTTEEADYFGAVAAEELSETEASFSRSDSSPAIVDSLTRPRQGSSFDWTRLPISAALPRHILFARSIDWASTPLGPIENWTFDLRAMCNLIMASPHPAAMYWGDEYIAIYNEAYILIAGQRHPSLMGQSYKTAWAEIWDDIEGVFTNARESGQATMKDDDCLFMTRNGYVEESYFSWSIIPLIGEDGSVVGLYNPCFEKTRRKIAERRMLTLRDVGERTAAAREIKGFWKQVMNGLESNEHDIPFALIYSVGEDSDSETRSIHSGSLSAAAQLYLEGTLGVPQGHRAALSPLDLMTSDNGFAPYLRDSMRTKSPILLTTEDDTLSYDLIEGMEWRGFGDPCRAVVICPIHPTTGDNILGFLIVGVNPRRPYDDDYSLFIQLLSRQLATSMASALLFEEEIRRGQAAARLAALDRQQLSEQLDLRTKEAVESETKFTRMAEFAPVGMFIASSDGNISYSNDTWWEISRHPRTENSVDTWMDSVNSADREELEKVWRSLVVDKTPVTHEFRFKTPWEDPHGELHSTWVLMSAYPEKDEKNQLKSVFGSITNISHVKWAEDFQKKRGEEALDAKRQQENFVDLVSHEIRNPLSAILQCADEISSTLSDFTRANDAKITHELADILESGIDAAQTIALCAQHQKRIVDDILTLSKLDSALLVVSPVAVQPVAVVQRALKMFEGELDSNDIAMQFRMEKSYLDMNIDWVKLDPSRLLQVLINLTTNAIKFTNGQDKRTIVVSVGASIERPNEDDSDVTYFPTRSTRSDLTADEEEWGSGENVYLRFAVQDTGRGLDKQEKTILFQRFRQASPRTHVQYGGSGLGLFISRELTELQGGEIGVSSERGVGSTFAFYVKARRAQHMPTDTPVAMSVNSLRRVASNGSGSITLESRNNSSGKAVYRSNTTGGLKARSAVNAPPVSGNPGASLDYSKLKVLIVEDNVVNQKVLQKQLKNIGFITQVANHGGEALDIIKSSKFWKGKEEDGQDLAVILMDLEMPIMDGLTAARTIRSLELDGSIVRHVPVIAVTANARLEQIETAIAAGMDDVVSKPFRIPELIPKIGELLTKSTSTIAVRSRPASPAISPSITNL